LANFTSRNYLFLEAEGVFTTTDTKKLKISNRIKLNLNNDSPSSQATNKIRLQEAILVASHNQQVKFSELSLDCLRTSLSLEYEMNEYQILSSPSETIVDIDALTNNNIESKTQKNPHKCLLYRPQLSTLLVYLANAYSQLSSNTSAMLVYISAYNSNEKENKIIDGSLLNDNADNNSNSDGILISPGQVVSNCKFYAQDLISFTRKPLFVIIDSDTSTTFKSLTSVFVCPLVCLMSPTSIPSSIKLSNGNLFTLFLNSPLAGLCSLIGVKDVSYQLFESLHNQMQIILHKIHQLLTSFHNLDPALNRFLEDDFLRLLVIKFVFCSTVFASHKLFKDDANFQPKSQPIIPNDLIKHTVIIDSIVELIKLVRPPIDITQFFPDISTSQ